MNIFQSMNVTSFFLALSALLVSVNSISGFKVDLVDDALSIQGFLLKYKGVLVFCLFFILLKIKITFDDHKHFRDRAQDSDPVRAFGFLLAVSSWLFWPLSAYAVENLKKSALLLAVALGISSLWIVVQLVRLFRLSSNSALDKRVREMRLNWFWFNVLYIAGLLFYVARSMDCPYLSLGVLLVCVCMLFFDMVLSRTFYEAWENKPNELL